MAEPTQLQVVRPEGRGGRSVRIRFWLAGAMWVPVLAANLIAVALGITLPFLDEILGDQPALPITLPAVEAILGALAAGMITFTGIVFSAVLVAAQLQTTSYSPRLATRLRRDPVVIAGLALPTATASYALFALGAIGRQTHGSADQVASALTVGVALLLAFVTFAGFIALVHRALDSTQIGGILHTIFRRTDEVIRDMHPIGPGTSDLPHTAADGGPVFEVTHSGPPGVLASVDRGALVRLSLESDAFAGSVVAILVEVSRVSHHRAVGRGAECPLGAGGHRAGGRARDRFVGRGRHGHEGKARRPRSAERTWLRSYAASCPYAVPGWS